MTHEPTNVPSWLGELSGKFIVFEGPDGSGKSTQYKRFVSMCAGAGVELVEAREPGGTVLGERIREILLHPEHEAMSLRCEMLLYMASRAQLVSEVIRPALEGGKLVLADRFVQSTMAYQGAYPKEEGGLSWEEIRAVADVVCQEVAADLVLIFDVDEATAAGRMNGSRDRIERRDAEYRERVREGYRRMAREDPAHHVVLDATRSEDEIARDVLGALGRVVAAT
jgi:dTMP kinase